MKTLLIEESLRRFSKPTSYDETTELCKNLKEMRGNYAASTQALPNAFEEQETSDFPQFKRHECRALGHGHKARSTKESKLAMKPPTPSPLLGGGKSWSDPRHTLWASAILFCINLAVTCVLCLELNAADGTPSLEPLFRTVDLNVNEEREMDLADGSLKRVKLISVLEKRDPLRGAVRRASVTVEINGKLLVLTSAKYNLPVAFAGVQIDCPITKGYVSNSRQSNPWGLLKDARLRIWPADSPWIKPGTFLYPVKQRWFASATQMANEPTYVDGGGSTECEKHILPLRS